MHAFRPLLRLLLVCSFSLTVLSSGAPAQGPAEGEAEGEEEIGKYFDKILIPPGMSKEDIQQAIAEALTGRGWTVRKKTDRRVVGYLNHGGAEAFVTMRFHGEAVEIYAYGWDLNRAGERAKEFYPTRWLRYLRRDLEAHLQP